MANVKLICRKVGVASPRVFEKACELYRISKIRRPVLGRAEFARSALCVDCACRVCDETPRDVNHLIKLSGVNKTMYNSLLGQFQTLLNIRAKATHSTRSLAIQFGVSSMVPFIEATLETFKERFINSLADERKDYAKFTSPAYKAAAFFLCAQKRKRNLDKYKLLKLTAVDAHEFKSTCNVMLLHCFDTLGIGNKSDVMEITDHRELIDNCRISNINQSTEVEKERKYQEWKKTVLENRQKGITTNSSSNNESHATTTINNIHNIKKRKQGIADTNDGNDENVPNRKKAKPTLPTEKKLKAVEYGKKKATVAVKRKKQPTIDDFVTALLKH
jgi:hypothetical protein